MEDLQTFTDIDVVISNITGGDIETDSQSPFFIKPTLNQPNKKPGMNKQISTENNNIAGTSTARSYEMSDGIIHESFSTLEDSDNSAEILADTDMNPANDIIIVLTDDVKCDELTDLYNKFKNRLKLIIHYGSNNEVKQIFEHFSQIISVNSLKKAVNKSYLLVQNGQTILFPRTEKNFDFFRHVDFVYHNILI